MWRSMVDATWAHASTCENRLAMRMQTVRRSKRATGAPRGETFAFPLLSPCFSSHCRTRRKTNMKCSALPPPHVTRIATANNYAVSFTFLRPRLHNTHTHTRFVHSKISYFSPRYFIASGCIDSARTIETRTCQMTQKTISIADQ